MYRNIETPYTYTKTPMRVMLLVAFVLAALLVALFVMGGMNTLFVYYWAYFALIGGGLLDLALMAVVGIRHRIKKNSTRRYATIALFSIFGFLAITAASFVYSIAAIGETPYAYETSPEGTNRLVIMKDGESKMTAYPMTGAYFYRPTFADGVTSATFEYEVVWESETFARVQLRDAIDDEEHREIAVDFTVTEYDLAPSATAEGE